MIALLASILTLITNTSLGIFVLVRNPKGSQNRHFFLMTISLMIWVLTLVIYYASSDPLVVLWVGRLNFAIGGSIFFFFCRFVYLFPRVTLKIPKLFGITAGIISTLIFLISFFTPLVDKNEIISGAERYVEYGSLYPIWAAYVFLGTIVGIIILVLKLRQARGVIKTQLNYLLFGFLIMFTFGLTTNVILPYIFNYYALQAFGPIATIFFLGITTYAMVKHRLLDIRLIAARTITYSLLVIILGSFYAGGLFAVSSFLIKDISSLARLATSTTLALLIALSFQPLRLWLQKITDSVLYKGHYDSQEFLHALSETITTTLTLSNLTYMALDLITSTMRLTKASFATIRNKKLYISESHHEGKHLKITLEEFKRFQSETQAVVFDEIPDGVTKTLMQTNEISMIIPLRTREHYIGLLLLGSKSSGDIFFDQDIGILEIAGPELAVALQNAQRFEEISQFNVTLQEEVKKATAELRIANAKLEKLDDLKDEFISIASHDLRTPLATVKNYLYLVKDDLGDAKPTVKDNLAIAIESTEHGISLVGDMLDVSRIEAGRIELKPERLNISQEAKLVVEELKGPAGAKKIKLTANIATNHYVKADKERVHQVLTNLTTNALKFTPPGGRVTLSVNPKGKMIEIAVADTGIGIKREDLGKLFTKFGKLESGANIPKSAGTGLGLYVSKNIVELSGGKIWVESAPNKGSIFTFSLPVA